MLNIDNLPTNEILKIYGNIIRVLKGKKIIRSRNIIGDIGEYLAIEFYNKTPGLPKLQLTHSETKNVDAISIEGERYSIKTRTTGNVTGTFYGLNEPGSVELDRQNFEYVLIVILDDEMNLERINEVNWQQFLTYKSWNSRMKAWRLPLTKDLFENTKTVFLKANSL